jgi:hypothetical protein
MACGKYKGMKNPTVRIQKTISKGTEDSTEITKKEEKQIKLESS